MNNPPSKSQYTNSNPNYKPEKTIISPSKKKEEVKKKSLPKPIPKEFDDIFEVMEKKELKEISKNESPSNIQNKEIEKSPINLHNYEENTDSQTKSKANPTIQNEQKLSIYQEYQENQSSYKEVTNDEKNELKDLFSKN